MATAELVESDGGSIEADDRLCSVTISKRLEEMTRKTLRENNAHSIRSGFRLRPHHFYRPSWYTATVILG